MEELSVTELVDRIKGGQISSLEATQSVFARIEKYETKVGAYISTFEEQALERAKEIDNKIASGESVGELAGVPVAILTAPAR